MIVCPACGEENPERARFCLACGEELGRAAAAGEERKVVSVLFVDLVGFTSRSDRADPEDVRATLRPYHERVKADIERFGGTVEKFIGDAVVAVFGAPVAHEDDAERAVRSALRVLETIEELREAGLELAVRAAVTTGETVVSVGARPERGEGIVTGDVVNTAARLQAAAPVGAVVVDETTMRATNAIVAYEPLDAVDAKGKADPIPVWRAARARARVGQPEAAVQTPFVGREHEQRLLHEIFLRAERESSVQLVTVVGEPGIGKSRLVTELRAVLDDRPELVTWRHGRCLPYGEGITFWALGEIVKAEAGILESDDQAVAGAKLDEMLAGLVGDDSERVWFASRLAPLVGAGADGPGAAREEQFAAWRRFLETLAARRPCVFVFEDLHWADPALLDFLEHVLEWSPPVPLLLLCTARPELFERSASWGGGKRNATTIALSPLSQEEAGRLLHLLLERTLLPAETQSTLLERAGGNPLYAEQFARMLRERAGVEELTIPETVQALIAARLDTLSPELKALVQDASVVGRVFWSGSLAASGGRERDDVRRSLNELVRREFVRPIRVSSVEGEDEFSFWHALVRDVAYQQIPRARRAEKHIAAASWVETSARGRLEDVADTLVHHYGEALGLLEAAGETRPEIRERLAQMLVLAGERALQLDISAAQAYFRRVLALEAPGTRQHALVLTRLAEALWLAGDAGEALTAYEEAIPVLRAEDEQAAGRALASCAAVLWLTGETERGRDANREAIELLERHRGLELVRAYGWGALSAAIGGDFERATAWIDQGLLRARELGAEEAREGIELLQARAVFSATRGDPGRALQDVRKARDIAARLGLAHESAIAMNNLADGLLWARGVEPAREAWEEVIRFSHQRGLSGLEMWQRGERLRCLYHAGEWDDLVRESQELLRWVEARGGGQLEVYPRVQLAGVSVHRGALEDAQVQVEALLRTARKSGDPQVVVPGLATAALVAAASGDHAQALGHVVELELVTREVPIWRALCLAGPAQLALAAGRPSLAEAFLEGSASSGAWATSARLTALASLAQARGDLEEARRLFSEAAERWREWGSVLERAYALLGLGRCGDAAALREGEAVFVQLGASPLLAVAA